METLFTKINEGKIPSVKIYEDPECFVILDINPIAKGHCLVISKEVYPSAGTCPDALLSHMICVAKKMDLNLREKLNCQGTNFMINNDPCSGQEIPHLHIHVIPRYENDQKNFGLKHDSYADGEMATLGDKLRI